MGNIVQSISHLVSLKEENNKVFSDTNSDVPSLLLDSNFELSLSDLNSGPFEISYENFEIGENGSVTPPLTNQSAIQTTPVMPKARARPKPKPRSVQLRERELMNSDESLSHNTCNKVDNIIKPILKQPSPRNLYSSTDDDSDYEAEENKDQNIEETKKVLEEPIELAIPRTIKLDKNGKPIDEKCNCYYHRKRNIFVN